MLFRCTPHHFGATHTKLQSAVRSLRCTPHHFPHHYEPPHHFVVATPTNLRHAEFAALLPGRIWIWSRPLRNRTLTHDIIMAFTFIPSTPPISYSFNFSFQRLDWPVGSGGLNISPLARWVVCPPGRTRGHGPGIKSLADSRIQLKIQCSNGRFPATWPLGQQREEPGGRSNLHSASDISPQRSEARERTFTLTYRSCRVEHVVPLHPASLWRYAYETPKRRALSPLHSASLSASLRTPTSLCGRYAYESPPCRVCCSTAWPDLDLVSSSTQSHPHP